MPIDKDARGELYAITDIGHRMLMPRKLYNAQGFPPDYIIDAGADREPMTKAAQVARCRNLAPPFAEALNRANLPELCGVKIESMKDLRKMISVCNERTVGRIITLKP